MTVAASPVLLWAAGGVSAAGAALLGQLDSAAGGADWTQTGALGLLGTSSVMIVLGFLRGDVINKKHQENIEALAELVRTTADLAAQGHAREQVHERFMTAAIDRILEQDRQKQDRQKRDPDGT
jgi:hypothetical protein